MNRLILAAACVLLASTARTEDKAGAPGDEMMKAWQDFATPNDNHKRLAAFVGSWKTHSKWWMKPGGAPEESDGAAEIKSVLGGRYIEQHMDGKMMGQPFSGIGFTGYDNLKKKYVSIWLDNMGTSILYVTGKADGSGKVIKSAGTVDDPMTKKPQKYQDAVTLKDPDTFTYEAWGPEPGGTKMYRMMEIVYTRSK